MRCVGLRRWRGSRYLILDVDGSALAPLTCSRAGCAPFRRCAVRTKRCRQVHDRHAVAGRPLASFRVRRRRRPRSHSAAVGGSGDHRWPRCPPPAQRASHSGAELRIRDDAREPVPGSENSTSHHGWLLRNLFGFYQALTTTWRMYDNSAEEPQLIASGIARDMLVANDAALWRRIRAEAVYEG
jgi:hypothetical protein